MHINSFICLLTSVTGDKFFIYFAVTSLGFNTNYLYSIHPM
ncbi:MAG: hypothetical protein ABJA90_08030 [Ginsengibacter sp.]